MFKKNACYALPDGSLYRTIYQDNGWLFRDINKSFGSVIVCLIPFNSLPSGFFDRLNRCLAIPLKPEWAEWLWEQGQQSYSRFTIQTKREYENGQAVEREQLVETSDMPISRLSSLGDVACYSIACADRYRDVWLQIIREQLDLAIRLQRQSDSYYVNGTWVVSLVGADWQLNQGDEAVFTAPTLNYLLTKARAELGVHFVTEGM